jgi:hypothetical protein
MSSSLFPPSPIHYSLTPSSPLSGLGPQEIVLPPPLSPLPPPLPPRSPLYGLGPQGVALLRYIVNLHLTQALTAFVRTLPAEETCALTVAAQIAREPRDVVQVAHDVARVLKDEDLGGILQSIVQCILIYFSLFAAFSFLHSRIFALPSPYQY